MTGFASLLSFKTGPMRFCFQTFTSVWVIIFLHLLQCLHTLRVCCKDALFWSWTLKRPFIAVQWWSHSSATAGSAWGLNPKVFLSKDFFFSSSGSKRSPHSSETPKSLWCSLPRACGCFNAHSRRLMSHKLRAGQSPESLQRAFELPEGSEI